MQLFKNHLGISIGANLTASAFALNAALSGGFSANWLAFGFVAGVSDYVVKVRVYVSAVALTLGASDLLADIYSDSAGSPNASIESRATVTTTPTGALMVEFTGFTSTSTLTAGTQYWVVLRNANIAPTTNYPTYGYRSLATLAAAAGMEAATWGAVVKTSVNSGGAWTLQASGVASLVVEYNGGAKDGQAIMATTTAGAQVYSARELGWYFVSPPGIINVIGVHAQAIKNGTPTGNLRFRIYAGAGASPTLLGTTLVCPAANIDTNRRHIELLFASAIAIPANTVLRVVMSETTQSDASGNRYHCDTTTLNPADAALWPGGAPQLTTSTDGGATFSETAATMLQMALILDPAGEMTSAGSISIETNNPVIVNRFGVAGY